MVNILIVLIVFILIVLVIVIVIIHLQYTKINQLKLIVYKLAKIHGYQLNYNDITNPDHPRTIQVPESCTHIAVTQGQLILDIYDIINQI